MIPKIIHQIYFNLYDKSVEEIPLYKKSIETLKKINPNYNHILWTEKKCEKLLKSQGNKYFDFYKQMKYNIQRIDFMRFVILYTQGGFYADLDLLNIKKLDTLLNKKFVGYTFKKFIPKHPEFIQSDFFGAPKNSKIFLLLMDLCEPNYNKVISKKIYNQWKGRFVLQTTGPRYVSRIIKKYIPSYVPHQNIVYTKWRNDVWKKEDVNNYYFENYVSGGWFQDTSVKLKNNKNFTLKENEI